MGLTARSLTLKGRYTMGLLALVWYLILIRENIELHVEVKPVMIAVAGNMWLHEIFIFHLVVAPKGHMRT